VAPDKATLKPYALLAQAMEESGKVGIARFVMRSKQYLCAVRPKDGKLLLSTMVYADELNDATEIPEIADLEGVKVSDKELDMARQLIASLSADFEAEQFEDTYRNRVLDLIERKAAGQTEIIAPPVAMEEDKVVDLMAALEASVKSAKAARQRHPAAGTDEAEETATPAKKRARKSA
jgi:DNA end-binding protein Ku